MQFNKSFIVIETVTFVTLLGITFSVPLIESLKRSSRQGRLENSITLNAINNDNSEYPSYGNELYDAYPIQESYREKETIYSQASKYSFNDEQYPNTENQEEKEEKVTTHDSNINNNSDQASSSRMEFNSLVVLVVVVLVLLVLIAIGCGIFMICKKDNPETGPGYSVAVSNRLFKAYLIFASLHNAIDNYLSACK